MTLFDRIYIDVSGLFRYDLTFIIILNIIDQSEPPSATLNSGSCSVTFKDGDNGDFECNIKRVVPFFNKENDVIILELESTNVQLPTPVEIEIHDVAPEGHIIGYPKTNQYEPQLTLDVRCQVFCLLT